MVQLRKECEWEEDSSIGLIDCCGNVISPSYMDETNCDRSGGRRCGSSFQCSSKMEWLTTETV